MHTINLFLPLTINTEEVLGVLSKEIEITVKENFLHEMTLLVLNGLISLQLMPKEDFCFSLLQLTILFCFSVKDMTCGFF